MLLVALLLLGEVVAPPGVVIDHEPASTRQYIGSPSLAILPGGDYVASHDFFGAGSTQGVSAVTRVFRSTDRGRTWTRTAEMKDQFWSTLFTHRGRLYLMGTTCEYGRIVIRDSRDGGRNWSAASYLTEDTGYHTAPVPVAIHQGRIWRAMEFHPTGPWGSFEAFVISAPVKSDLMQPSSWIRSARLSYPAQEAGEGRTWLEGNAVIARDGQLLDILRVDNLEKAALVRAGKDQLRFDRLVPFPGGAKKFTIRWDPKSKRYWALANPAPPDSKTPASVRNTLALISSADLREWRTERVLLTHPDVAKHGFQYVDWQFEGKEIVAAVRTAFDDEDGGAHNFHDANFLLFLRVPDFRAAR